MTAGSPATRPFALRLIHEPLQRYLDRRAADRLERLSDLRCLHGLGDAEAKHRDHDRIGDLTQQAGAKAGQRALERLAVAWLGRFGRHPQTLGAIGDTCDQDVELGADLGVERPLGDMGACGDLERGGVGETAFGERGERGLEDARAHRRVRLRAPGSRRSERAASNCLTWYQSVPYCASITWYRSVPATHRSAAHEHRSRPRHRRRRRRFTRQNRTPRRRIAARAWRARTRVRPPPRRALRPSTPARRGRRRGRLPRHALGRASGGRRRVGVLRLPRSGWIAGRHGDHGRGRAARPASRAWWTW